MSESGAPKPKNLADGVSVVQIAGKDVLIYSNAEGVQYLHNGSYVAAVLGGTDNAGTKYWREKIDFDHDFSRKVENLYQKIHFCQGLKKGVGIQFKAAVLLLQKVKTKHASLDHCRLVVEDLLKIYSGDKGVLTDLWDKFDAQFSGLISLEEIVPNAKIEQKRVNGVQYLNVLNLIMVMCQKTEMKYANRIWKNMRKTYKLDIESELKPELRDIQFRSNPSNLQLGITFPGAMKLIMWLPGSFAKEFRSQAAHLLIRYFAGDKTMLKEVLDNATSSNPLFDSCRQSLETTQECAGEKRKLDISHGSLEFFHAIQDNIESKHEESKYLYPKQGVVYAMENRNSFPGIYKIGYTTVSLAQRLSALNVSFPFKDLELVMYFKSFYPEQAELEAHEFFQEYRLQGEYFSVPKESLVGYFQDKQKVHLNDIVKIQKSNLLKKCISGWKDLTYVKVSLGAQKPTSMEKELEKAANDLFDKEESLRLDQQKLQIDKAILELEKQRFEIEKHQWMLRH